MTSKLDVAHLERLIDRQIRQWDLFHRRGEEEPTGGRDAAPRIVEGPWITCSKQLGGGGRVLGRRLAERLGWQVFDKEILEAISRETRCRDRIVSRLDERLVGTFRDYIAHLVVPDHLPQAAFIAEMMKVIWALGRQGQAVLLGRGANWLLDPRFGLRVRVVASMEHRIGRVAEMERLDRAEAERRIREEDATRAAFIRKVYRRDIDDPLGYDLVLNMDGLVADAALEVVLTALRRKLGDAVAAR